MPRSVRKNLNRKSQRTKRKQLKRVNKKLGQRKNRTKRKQLRRKRRTQRKNTIKGGASPTGDHHICGSTDTNDFFIGIEPVQAVYILQRFQQPKYIISKKSDTDEEYTVYYLGTNGVLMPKYIVKEKNGNYKFDSITPVFTKYAAKSYKTILGDGGLIENSNLIPENYQYLPYSDCVEHFESLEAQAQPQAAAAAQQQAAAAPPQAAAAAPDAENRAATEFGKRHATNTVYGDIAQPTEP